MAGVGIEGELCSGDQAGESLAVGKRVERVGGAIGDEGGGGDRGGLPAGRVSAGPSLVDCVSLGGHDGSRDYRGSGIAGGRGQAGVLRGGLTGGKQDRHHLLRVPAAERAYRCLGRPDGRAVAWPARAQDQAAHLVGCMTVRTWAIMLPIDQPRTSGCWRPSVLMSALVWRAIASMLSGAGRARVAPMPALSGITTW